MTQHAPVDATTSDGAGDETPRGVRVELRTSPGTDPIERVLGVLRVRAPRYRRLEYTPSTSERPGLASLELAATPDTIARLQRYLARVIDVYEISVVELDDEVDVSDD